VFKHILISTDGSPISSKAAKAGIALASALGAKVTAYCALEQMQPLYAEGYAFDQEVIDGIEKRVRGVGQKARRRDRQDRQGGRCPVHFDGDEGFHCLRGNHRCREKTEVRRDLHGLARPPRAFQANYG
jgi:nucleotide-binding universal stress UspA family protein